MSSLAFDVGLLHLATLRRLIKREVVDWMLTFDHEVVYKELLPRFGPNSRTITDLAKYVATLTAESLYSTLSEEEKEGLRPFKYSKPTDVTITNRENRKKLLTRQKNMEEILQRYYGEIKSQLHISENLEDFASRWENTCLKM